MIGPQQLKGMLVLQVPHLKTITSVGRGSCIRLLSSRTFHRKEVDERPVTNVSIVVDIDIMLNIHFEGRRWNGVYENIEDVFTLNWEVDMDLMF